MKNLNFSFEGEGLLVKSPVSSYTFSPDDIKCFAETEGLLHLKTWMRAVERKSRVLFSVLRAG